ncbi:MAG TPA: outer membrane protein assembly factor BamE [Accumulibacter sp.]|nr:outer membrane protein assembly factor BamE [Accumulibacter sp.]
MNNRTGNRFPSLMAGLLCLALSACDADKLARLQPGVSSADDVKNTMGTPALEWKEADGTRFWEYPRTPEGVVNYRVTIAPDGKFREIRQLLTEENFARITPGMSRDNVRFLLGRPARQRHFSLKREWVWDWKTKTEPGMDWYFNVHFSEDGRVTNTSTHFEPRG